MRLIYLSILAITLSFSMNTFAEKETVNIYEIDKHPKSEKLFRVYCIDGIRYLETYHKAQFKVLVDEDNEPLTCNYFKE